MIEVRRANSNDANQIVEVMKNAEDSGFMMFNPGEREISAEPFAKYIESINSHEKSGVFVACEKERVLGYLIIQSDKPQRVSHRAYIVIGVHSESRGKGIGKELFVHVMKWAKQVGLHRLELTVIKTNDAAFGLYKKMGFEVEGVKRDSLLIDGNFVDEYYLSKLL